MECDQRFPSQPFVILIVDQFFGHGGGLLERRKQNSYVYQKSGTLLEDKRTRCTIGIKLCKTSLMKASLRKRSE